MSVASAIVIVLIGLGLYHLSHHSETQKASATDSSPTAATANYVDQQMANESTKVDQVANQISSLDKQVNALLSKPELTVANFTDLSNIASSTKDKINYLLGKKIVGGYTDPNNQGKRLFKPYANITRYQAAVMILNAKGIAIPSSQSCTSNFADIQDNSVYCPVAEAAYKAGIFSGNQTKSGKIFRPKDSLSRGEMAIILNSSFTLQGTKDTTFTPYPDVSSGSFSYDAVKTITEYHIANGEQDGKFYPIKPISRSQFSILLANTLDPSYRN